MQFKPAEPADMPAIMEIYSLIRTALISSGSDQWGTSYPPRQLILADLEAQQLYVVVQGNTIVGVTAISPNRLEQYQHITWLTPSNSRNLMIFRLATHPNYQRQQVGSFILSSVAALAKKQGYHSLRLNVYSQNKGGITFYLKNGYQQMPNTFKFKRHSQVSYCFELLL